VLRDVETKQAKINRAGGLVFIYPVSWSDCPAQTCPRLRNHARMRHPIYSAYIVFMISMALITANWFFIALLVLSIVVFAFRIPKEEQMLIETFGEEYKTYIQRTGGLFPK
jgi:protein-S-isoprenylcysteine O-methyltransferase Ste14